MLNFKNIHNVVIIGASEDTKKIGNILLAKNQTFQGKIYGINPKWGNAYGKEFYPSIHSLPEVPDIAVFAIPAGLISDSLEEAGKFGIKKAIIITAGFKEIGNTNEENQLITIAKKYNIRILGPNCLGYGDTHLWLNLSFWSQFFDMGNIGIISQSGAMAVAITDVLAEKKLGFSTFFSLGNKSDIDESDLLIELMEDPHTKVIALYLESITRWEFFIETLQKITQTKPVIIMIGWVSEHGKMATASHTGSLSWERVMYEAAIKKGWALLTYSLSEFFSLLQIFSISWERSILWDPFMITNAWGVGVLATDQAEFFDLNLARIDEKTSTILRKNMPAMMSTRNPIDIIGDADSERVNQVLSNILEIKTTADIIFFFTVQATTDINNIAEKIISFSQKNPNYNIFVTLIGGDTIIQAKELLDQAKIFTTTSTESMIGSYSKLTKWKIKDIKLASSEIHAQHTETKSSILLDQDMSEKLLAEYLLQSTNTHTCNTLEDILKYRETKSGPFIMKISGKYLAHKTEIGGVIWPVSSISEITHAYETLQKNITTHLSDTEQYKITIAKFITPSPSIELFFGAKRDINFWETFIIGTGWIYLTILDDTSINIGKWNKEVIWNTLKSLKSYPALSGYRKQQSVDMNMLETIIFQLSKIFFEHPEIREIDINPILFDNGIPYIADAKFYLEA